MSDIQLPKPARQGPWPGDPAMYSEAQMLAMYQQGATHAASRPADGVPAGWKLVPIEPNWDMRNEGREFLIDGLEKEPEKLAYFLWKTMVAAAPEVK